MAKPVRRTPPRPATKRPITQTRSRRPWVIGAAAVVVVIVVVAVVLVGFGGGGNKKAKTPAAPAAHALTTDEADRLAVSRFLDYQSTGVQFSTSVPSSAGQLPLVGYVDFKRKLGYAMTAISASDQTQAAVLQWNGVDLATWLGTATKGVSTPPATLPPGDPTGRALSASSSAVDTVLLLLLNLGSDRPDNAQLLQQSDARWLRKDTVNGVAVDVIAGPSSSVSATSSASPSSSASSASTAGNTQYWIDSTGRLLRFVATVSGQTVTIDLDKAAFVKFPAYSKLQ